MMKVISAIIAALLTIAAISCGSVILASVLFLTAVVIIATITLLDALSEIRDRLPEKKIDDKNG